MSVDAYLREEIREIAHSAGDEQLRTAAVFHALAGIVAEAGFLTNPQWTPLRFKDGRQNCAIDGYDIDEEDGLMTLFAVIDCHSELDLDQQWNDSTCPTKALNQAVAGMENAVTAISAGRLPDLDKSDPALDMIKSLTTEYSPDRGAVAFCILTTGHVTDRGASESAEKHIRTTIWSADRLIRLRENGREQLVADFEPLGGLPCLISDAEAQQIEKGQTGVLITKIPGTFLAAFYNEHRMRLLERNVRAFLQFTGKVNKGIRDTIQSFPDRFLSYNNGISVTASKVRMERAADGIYRMLQAEDFQIVNGGQTTASIARCAREKDDISSIHVAMKLTVVPPELIPELVPKISQYANTQNRIREDDFHANNPWHVALEKHSRTIEAERDAESEGRPIRWYYERVRGQYADELAKHVTRAQKDAFKHRHPSRTKFTKTDLSRYLLAWEQEAHTVSLGGQKCFARLMTVLGATSTNADANQLPTEEDFRRMCGIGIMQRHGEQLCHEFKIVGYRANLVAYAIMVMSVKTDMRFPWRRTWANQEVPAEIDHALRIAIPACDRAIRKSAGQQNISEWAKKKECREYVLQQAIELSLKPAVDWDRFSIKDMARPKAEVDLLKVLGKLTADHWLLVAKAAKRDKRNPVWEGVANTMATRLVPASKSPSEKQAKILKKALVAYNALPGLKNVLSKDDLKLLEN